MTRHPAWTAALVLGLGLALMARPAFAVITRLIPLREALASEQLIFIAKVAKLRLDKPAMVLQVSDDLKGKAPFRKLDITLIADSQGQREGDTPKLLKRLAPDLAVIVFTSKRGKRYTAFAYTNGTWFQLVGQAGDDAAPSRWNFTHCEPYLRRTFHGTTPELRQIIVDALADKKKPPEPDPKEAPGLGPELNIEEKAGSRSEKHEATSWILDPRSSAQPLRAVIPTFVIVGPLALLATLFPAIFGGLALFMRRWVVFLSIASVTSMLYLGHSWFHGTIKDSWWGKPAALWCTLGVIALAGLYWSGRRQANSEESAADPGRGECIILWSISLIGLAVVAWCIRRGTLLNPLWKDFLVIWGVAWVGTLYMVGRGFASRRQLAPALPSTERVMLWALTFACAATAATSFPWSTQGDGVLADGVRLVWTFEPKEKSAIISSPTGVAI